MAKRFDARTVVEYPVEAPDEVVDAIDAAIAKLVYDWPRDGWDPFVYGKYRAERRGRRAQKV